MKILILGSDGYIGWPLALSLQRSGHEIVGVDNLSRRRRAPDCLTPILSSNERGEIVDTFYTDATRIVMGYFKPDCIIHLAEQPSAPWSMAMRGWCEETVLENIRSTLFILWLMKTEAPNTHLVKLGTMGEYGTPDCEIPEGKIPHCLADQTETYECPMKGLQFPRSPGSFYHASKVADSVFIEMCCRLWGLRSTDIMQGIVFGLNHWDPEHLVTRFDYDQYFGTVINRFCTQAVAGLPITPYGKGGQTRGFLPLSDSIECIKLAVENPPRPGEYRVFNQFARTYSITELAEQVARAAILVGLNPSVTHVENPRVEAESHIYEPRSDGLRALGYNPTWDIQELITRLIKALIPFKDNIVESVIAPTTRWR